MSWVSKTTGIHISPHGVKIEPLKALATGLTAASLGGFGPLAGIGSKIGSVASHIPGAGAITGAVANHGGLSGIGGSLLDFAKGHGSQILAGLQIANAAHLGKKANQYADNANNMANQSYMERAGLRSAGINDLLHPQVPDTSGLARIRSSNPYSGLQLAGGA